MCEAWAAATRIPGRVGSTVLGANGIGRVTREQPAVGSMGAFGKTRKTAAIASAASLLRCPRSETYRLAGAGRQYGYA